MDRDELIFREYKLYAEQKKTLLIETLEQIVFI